MHNSKAGAGPRGSSQQSPHDANPKSVSQADVLGGSSRCRPFDRQPVYGYMQ